MISLRQRILDQALPLVVFGMTGLVFFPVIHWLTARTIANEQLLHAFLVFLLTGALLIHERRISIRPVLSFGTTSQNVLIVSYILLAVAIFSRLNLIILAALCLGFVAFLLFFFGEEKKRLIYSSVGAFALFTALAVTMPVLDWPLRSVAGQCTTYGLNLIGQRAELGLYQGGDQPMLMLLYHNRPFHVAAECNGFGMLTSSLLMASILLLYQNLSWPGRLVRLAGALLFGLLANTLRIVVIVLIAPHIADGHYMLMHEAVGIATTYGGLAVLYFLLMPRRA